MNIIELLLDIVFGVAITSGSSKYKTTSRTGGGFKRDEKHIDSSEKVDFLEFTILLLTYMMTEDDGKISFKEKMIITREFKRYHVYLTKENKERLQKLTRKEFGLDYIITTASNLNLSKKDIKRGFTLLKIINKEEKKYTGIINKIERHFRLDEKFI